MTTKAVLVNKFVGVGKICNSHYIAFKTDYDKNRMSKKPLSLGDRKVFPEGQERFKLSSHDTYKAIRHTQKKKKPR